MSEPIQIIIGANQPSEIWQGIPKDEATIERFERLMRAFGLSDEQIQAIKGNQSDTKPNVTEEEQSE